MCYIHKGIVNNTLLVAPELPENRFDAQAKFFNFLPYNQCFQNRIGLYPVRRNVLY